MYRLSRHHGSCFDLSGVARSPNACMIGTSELDVHVSLQHVGHRKPPRYLMTPNTGTPDEIVIASVRQLGDKRRAITKFESQNSQLQCSPMAIEVEATVDRL